MAVEINFVRDVASILRKRLAEAGYSPVPGETDEETIRRYLNVLHRTIEQRQRVTRKSKNFSCPPEHQAGLRALLDTSEAGGDLRRYQSKSIDRADYDDGMLNDFGVQHFHLGARPDFRDPSFMDRTGPLLYAVVTTEDLYCLGVHEHGAWSKQGLLDVMHESFPELTSSNTLKGLAMEPTGQSHHYSDDDVKKLRDAGVNVVTQRPDGTIMIGPGGGVTLSKERGKKSSKVERGVIDFLSEFRDAEDELRKHFEQSGQDSANTNIQIIEENAELIGLNWRTGRRVRLGKVLRDI